MYKIYKITNKITGLNYIGFTKYTLDRRFNQHWKKSSKESNTKLYRAIQEYNDKSMWSIELVQDNIQENVIEIEKKYINLYNSYENGYNSNVGGTGNASGTYKHPQKIKDFLSSINKGKIPSENVSQKVLKVEKAFLYPMNIRKKYHKNLQVKIWWKEKKYSVSL